MDPSFWGVTLLLFALGASVGSFLNLLICRLPMIRAGKRENERRVTLSYPPSRCDACHMRIRWHDNLPVLGWIKRSGRCAGCESRFSSQHAWLEALAGVCGSAPFLVLGPTAASLFWAGAGLALIFGPLLARASKQSTQETT